MNEFCQNCRLCCKLIPIVDGQMLRDGFSKPFDFLMNISEETARKVNNDYVEKIFNEYPNAVFAKCKWLTEDNICTRLEKYNDCKNFPSSALAMIPDECCYLGDIFLKKEELKQRVRKYKEEIIHYEALIKSGDKNKNSYEKIIKSLQRFICKYDKYGALRW